MSHHMVIFENRDGHPGYNQFDSVEAAVGFVEDLRNNQGIEKFQIFELSEVKFELRPYYRVELKALAAGVPQEGNPAAARPGAPDSASSAPAQPRPTAAAGPAPAPGPTGNAEQKAAGEPSPAPGPAPAPKAAPSAARPAPVPPADRPQAPAEDQPARRGLFGR